MKKLVNMRFLSLLLLLGAFSARAQQDCKDDINYSISHVTVNGGAVPFISNENGSAQITVGQAYAGSSGSYNQGISSETGFWGHYILEPQAPRSAASEGEYVDRIEVEWEIVDDRKGPQVTGETTKVYRNGKLLTTIPISQTTYVDFNVFPGEFYTYEIVTNNDLGDAKPIQAVGFLNPNGRVTGKVETRSGAPVADVKVVLTPNLGRSLNFDGSEDYLYFIDQAFEFKDYYTIEGWWRNVENKAQTIFAAVDSSTTDHLVKISLDDQGRLHYFHDGDADGTGIELVSQDGYNLDNFSRKWHHFAVVMDTTKTYLYVDGNRVAETATIESISEIAELEIGKDGPKQYSSYFNGYLDDFRVWNVGRTREQIRRYMDITLTGEEEHLNSYWKFDEQFSNKVFDFANKEVEDREHGYICEVERTDFVSPAQLGAYTDDGGDYIIKGVYYGTGQTFAVKPVKKTPIGFSMDFDGTDDFISYQLDRITYDQEFTLEGWFKTPADGKDMVIFQATNDVADKTLIELGIQSSGEFYASAGFSGTLNTITTTDQYNDEFWYHYALVHEGGTVRLYIDGQAAGTTTDGAINDVIARTVIGRSHPIDFETGDKYWEGSLDEMRLWSEARTENQVNATLMQIIEGNEQGIVDPDGDKNMMAYWMLGEGQGAIISDATPNGHSGELKNFQSTTLSSGEVLVTNWNGDDIPLSVEFFEHDFDPNARNVSLDPSNTSVDRVDFTDISQLSISGFVKFANTNCFVEGAELTINEESLLPPVYTDKDGKFTLELEPGTTSAFMIPKRDGYDFDPGFIELPRIVRPLAGMKYETTTTRKLKGVVAGGECLYATGDANVRLLANDGCYEKVVAIDAATGEFEATEVPPLNYQVSVVDHENTTIQSFFDTKGAINVDLRDENDSVSFIYTSDTRVRLNFENPEANTCDIQLDGETATLLNQSKEYDLKIELYQVYGMDTCVLDAGMAYIEDEISAFSPRDTVEIANGKGIYGFKAGVPNLASPHKKTITVIGKDENDAESTAFAEVIVLGYKTLASTFETTTPQLPMFILRDPPGDASYSYLDKNEEVCNNISFDYLKESTSNVSSAIHMGADVEFSVGLGVTKTTSIDVTMDMNFESSATNSYGTSVEHETCLTSSEIFRTTDNDLFSNGEGDVFVGGAFNVLVGTNRVIDVNPDNCQLELEDVVMILPKGFATTYIYNEGFIKTGVIPGLEAIDDTESVEQWQAILDYNESLKNSAQFVENISFSAGIEFEKSVTSTQTEATTMSLSNAFASEIGVETGISVDGLGFSLGISGASNREKGFKKSSQRNTSKTVGYSLNDNDVGDNFTIDVKSDQQGMPVFDLIAGETSCPWEPGTKNRAAVNVTALSPTSLVDIPEDEQAVFKYSLGNVGETGEDDFFEFRVVQETNPNGAVIKFNGVLVEEKIGFFVRANESVDVTVTVEKGPEAFVYNDLTFEFYYACELQRVMDLPIDIEDLIANDPDRAKFFARQTANVEFVKTCQKPTIFSPGDDWLINGGDGNSLDATISEIDLAQPEFERLKFQYRLMVEGEPFVNGVTIEKSEITGDSHSFSWDVTDVVDGQYEVRVISECNSGFFPGISELATGRLDRAAPIVLGTPAPVDGVLGLDDEITIEFEEDVKCDAIISLGVDVSLEAGNENHVDLSDSETGLSIAKDVNCSGNKLIITPDIQNKFIEGKVLRVDLLGLEDLYGNVQTDQITWEFDVDRDPIEWLGLDVQLVAYEGESPSVKRQVKNNGGFAVNVNLSGEVSLPELNETLLPSWISASPRSFTLQPGGTTEVTFTISDQIGGGQYNDVVTAATSFGAPELRFDLRVLCEEPDWSVDASQFENSMNFTGQLDIRDELSEDEYDMVAAFVDDELRGIGTVTYSAELDNIGEHPYLVFMTLYTNSTTDEMIEFQVWDASRCQLYGQIAETYNISLSTAALGSPTDPKSITVTNNVIQNIPLSSGWNWFSLNLNANSAATDDLLGSLDNSRGDIIKSQDDFSQYVPGLGWVGPLATMDSTQAFRIKLNKADTMLIIGEPIDFETTTIELDSGWNWISFLPAVGMELNEALSGINATADFIIKSQTSFAQYVDQQGWIGSLDFMRPNEGYLIYTDRSASLEYPVNSSNSRLTDIENEEVQLPDGWSLEPSAFEFNSNLIFKVQGLKISEGDFIGLFDQDQLVGQGQARYISQLDDYYFFVTSYSNHAQTELLVSLYVAGKEMTTDVLVTAVADQLHGSVESPITIDLSGQMPEGTEPLTDLYLYPNPAEEMTTLAFGLHKNSRVKATIHNLIGQQIRTVLDDELQAGNYRVNIPFNSSEGDLTTGIYLIRLVLDDMKTTIKLLIK